MIVDFLRNELAPEPYRGMRALRLASIVVLSLGISLFADVASGLGAFLVVVCVAPDLSHTPRLLVRRVAAVVAIMVISVPLAGFLVELPWLAVPVVFLLLAIGGSLLPASRFPVEWMAVKFTVVAGLFAAQFAPEGIGTWGVHTAWSFIIPLTTATLVAASLWPESAQRLLEVSLADTFGWIAASLGRSRDRLAGAADAPAQAARLRLARHLGLIERLRREGAGGSSFFYGISTLAERAAHDAAQLDHATSQVGRSRQYLAEIRTELLVFLEALIPAVEGYARRFQRDRGLEKEEWPRFQEHLARLDAHRERLRSREWYARLGFDEVARVNDVLTTIRRLAERFRDPPDAFRNLVAPARLEEADPPAARHDPDNSRFSWRAATAATLAYVVATGSQHLPLETTIWTTLHAAQFTHGATLRKMILRVTGAAFGGALAILMILTVSTNTDDLGIYLGSIFVVAVPLYYVALGSPRVAYFGTQSTISFLLAYVSAAQVADVAEPLWRVTAIVFGDLILYATFLALGPELASKKIGPRLRRAQEQLARLLPRPHRLLERGLEEQTVAQLSAELERITTLAEEARFEGGGHRIDVQAVFELVAVSRRILGRLQAVHDLRRTLYRAEVPPPLLRAVEHFESVLGSVLEAEEEVPADSLAGDARADLDAAGGRLRHQLEAARSEITRFGNDERAAIYALYGDFDRLTELTRSYRASLARSLRAGGGGAVSQGMSGCRTQSARERKHH